MAKEKATQKKAGRPRKYEDAAARVRAFRAKAAYPGKRYDIYLGKDAHVAVRVQLKKNPGLSASSVIDAMIRCAHKVASVTASSLPITHRRSGAKDRQ